MQDFHVEHPHNEASSLLCLRNQRLLDERGWDRAFWILSDEAAAHRALAVLGRHRGRDGAAPEDWEVVRLKARRTKRSSGKATDDGEALARAGSWIYAFGSQFGSKDGPLEPARHFVARFNEALIESRPGKLKAEIEVARPAFLLHRLVNDALRAADMEPIPRGENARLDYVRAVLDYGEKEGKRWRERVDPGDQPVNVEGATFLPNGRLLLGLRFPVTEDGHPILVEIDGIDRLFEGGRAGGGPPQVTRLFTLPAVGSAEVPAGVRELDQQGTTVHVVTGDLDSDPDESLVIADHPEGIEACSAHHVFELPADGGGEVDSREVLSFSDDANVEGITVEIDGGVWYAHDDEKIWLTYAAP